MIAVRLFIIGFFFLIACCCCFCFCCAMCCFSVENQNKIRSWGSMVPLVNNFIKKPNDFEGGDQEEIVVESHIT
jgi:hypothetical protein